LQQGNTQSQQVVITWHGPLPLTCRLGAAWDEKKSICNKFLQGSPVTSLAWPQDHHNEVVFGVAEGKVKLGMLKTNKTYTLYSHPDNSYVVSLAPSLDGSALLSGHLDGSVYKCTLPKQEGGQGPGSSKLLQHHCVPHAIAWGQSILVAGNSCKVRRCPFPPPGPPASTSRSRAVSTLVAVLLAFQALHRSAQMLHVGVHC
jgi:intraflagellar transport protein 172